MSKGYMWIEAEYLERLLRLPEGVHITGIMSSEFPRAEIGIIVTGSGLPSDGATMSELVAIFESNREGDFRFVRWEGVSG